MQLHTWTSVHYESETLKTKGTYTRSCSCYNFHLLPGVRTAKLLCTSPPTHFFVPCSQVLPLCPAHISILTIMPRVLAVVLYYSAAADSVSVMILSEGFCFRNSMQQLHSLRGYNRCVYVYTISRIHNISTGFFLYNHFIPPPLPSLSFECSAQLRSF